jgi:Predicted outer membrane lipoprotein
MFRNSSTHSTAFVAVVFGAQLMLSACGGESVSAFEAANQAAPQAPAQQAPAPQPVANTPAPAPAPAPQCVNCGTVRAINVVAAQGQTSGVGAALGALVGGVVGNQIGGGSGKRIATVAGVVGGAVAGNTIEKRRNSNQEYEIVVGMDNGGEQRIRVYDPGPLSVGARVSVEGDTIIPR